MNKMFYGKKGITLVSLVITIVIMLILAGVSISLIIGNNGLFKKSKDSSDTYKEKATEEQSNLNKAEEDMSLVMSDVNADNGKDEAEEPKVISQYFIVDLKGIFGTANGSSISEVELYDKDNNKLTYQLPDDGVYDSRSRGTPTFWSYVNCWGKDNLYDGLTTHTGNGDGEKNAAIFCYQGDRTNAFVRFLVKLDSPKEINSFRICAGNGEDRLPNLISVYKVNSFDTNTFSNNITKEDNTGLTLLGTHEFTDFVKDATWYEFIN